MDAVTACGDRDLQEVLDWAITQTPVSIALIDTQMRQLRLNTSMCRVLGLDDEAAGLGLRLTDLLSNPESESCVAAAHMVARTGKPTVWRGINKMPGESRDHAVEVNMSPVKDPVGRVHGVLVVGFDVTEQHLARERLALVNEASTRIGGTLDVTRTAEELVQVAVPRQRPPLYPRARDRADLAAQPAPAAPAQTGSGPGGDALSARRPSCRRGR